MKIVFFNRTNGGCDYYRAQLPIGAMEKLGGHKVFEITKHELNIGIAKDDAEKLAPMLDADIVVLPRLAERGILDNVREVNPSAKIVLDYDDNLFEVSPMSPHYADYGTENVRIQMADGKWIDLWEDGKNINLAKNRALSDDVRHVLGEADLVTVTQPILAEAYRPLTNKITCLPNCIDPMLWRRLPLKPRENEIRMGWFGGASHYEDWTLLTEVLPRVMDVVPSLRLVIMGQKFDGTIKTLDPSRVEFHQWTPTAAYPYKAATLDLDFALIPLRDTKFNRCKSNIKWVEMSALSIPSVVSMVSPYKEFATEENGVWIENNDRKAWTDGIIMLAKDNVLQWNIGGAAGRFVRENFSIETQWKKWESAYQGVLNGVN